jgi:hypothetical protein
VAFSDGVLAITLPVLDLSHGFTGLPEVLRRD